MFQFLIAMGLVGIAAGQTILKVDKALAGNGGKDNDNESRDKSH